MKIAVCPPIFQLFSTIPESCESLLLQLQALIEEPPLLGRIRCKPVAEIPGNGSAAEHPRGSPLISQLLVESMGFLVGLYSMLHSLPELFPALRLESSPPKRISYLLLDLTSPEMISLIDRAKSLSVEVCGSQPLVLLLKFSGFAQNLLDAGAH